MSSIIGKTPRIGVWFAASATILLTRALLFSTWQSRAPEVQMLLHLNTAQMGLLAMLYPTGGLIGLMNATYLNQRFGSRRVTILGFIVGSAALAGLGLSIPMHLVWVSAGLLFVMGFPMGVADFVGNFEGSAVDRSAKRSLLPAIHAVFGIGMMGAAGLASLLTTQNVGITGNYVLIAVVAALPSIWAGLTFPKRTPAIEGEESKKAHRNITRKVWREPITWMVASIGFSFAIAEISAGTWVPIALTQTGFTAAAASAAFGFFWVVITVGRAVGGFSVDRFGLRATLLISAFVTAAGIALFIFNNTLHAPYLALALWGLGMANGVPLAINAMSDHAVESPARINMVIILCYTGMLVVGPALGTLGQLLGLQFAFALPVLLLFGAAFLTRVVRR